MNDFQGFFRENNTCKVLKDHLTLEDVEGMNSTKENTPYEDYSRLIVSDVKNKSSKYTLCCRYIIISTDNLHIVYSDTFCVPIFFY